MKPHTIITVGALAWLFFEAAFGAEAWPPSGELEWDGVYDAKDTPMASVPSWRESVGANTEYKIEEEGLRVIDGGTESGNLHCYAIAWRARPEEGAIVEGRIKLINNTSRSGVFLHASDGVHETSITLFPDYLSVNLENDEEFRHKMNTTDGFHIYRLAVRNTDSYVWVDGTLVFDGTAKFTQPAYSGRNRVMFGSCSSAAESEAVYADVRYATFGEPIPVPPRYAQAEDVVIYKKPGVYACFPSLVRADNTTFLTSFGTRTRRSHIDNTGGSARYASRDQGYTWEPYDGTWPIDDSMRNPDGSLVDARAYGWRQAPAERREEFEKQDITVRDVRPGVVAYLQGAYARRSDDSGETWQKRELELPAHRSLMTYNASARLRLSNGVFLHAIYGELKEDTVSRTFVLRSADNGQTWWFLPLAADLAGEVRFNETALCENADGEVIAMIRSEPPAGGCLRQSISKDSGITWSPGVETGMWGYPANLILLADGRMLCTYGYRKEPMGIRAALSSDGGHTWDTDNIIVLRNDAAPFGSDLGYPISVEKSPGEIFTIYYFTLDDGITHIAGTHWQVPPANQKE
ncbi:MAG: sialidase family protein [Candidatus Hydrogenedentes bacterium]|nr:sialidase family protein [Candidatus Hydrogenedentota bacterium]